MQVSTRFSYPQNQLTKRETEVINLLATGKTYAQIAAVLFVDIETVRKHANNIYTKMDVKNRMEAVIKYFKLNLMQ